MNSDIHALSGAYAVDALDDLERARFERHLAECEACTAEVDSLREASAVLAETTETAPPADLRARVLAEIATVRPLPPVVEPRVVPTTSGPQRRGRRWLTGLVAAAAVVTAVGVGAVWQPWQDDTSQSPRLSAAQQVMEAPDHETYTEELEGGATVTVYRSRSLDKAVVVTEGMQPPAPGKTYELWLQHGDTMVPAGLMPRTDRPVVMDGDAASAIGAGITIEDAAGASVPTFPPVVTFDFETT